MMYTIIRKKNESWTEAEPLLRTLHWLPVPQRVTFKILVYVYKALNEQAPLYITELFSFYTPTRPLWSSTDLSCLVVPKFHSVAGEGHFAVAAAKAWNCLPECIRTAHSTNVSRNHWKHTYIDFILLLMLINCFVNAMMLWRMAFWIPVVCMYLTKFRLILLDCIKFLPCVHIFMYLEFFRRFCTSQVQFIIIIIIILLCNTMNTIRFDEIGIIKQKKMKFTKMLKATLKTLLNARLYPT